MISLRDRRSAAEAGQWSGAYSPYDLVKELFIALAVVTLLAVLLTILFSSPDEKPSTIQSWSRSDPVDFVTTATTELDGSSTTGGYGPPYNHASDGQHMAFIYLQKWLGVSHPVDTAKEVIEAILDAVGKPRSLIRFVKDRLGHDRRYAIDPTRIEQEIGWRPRETWESGLAKTIRWYQENDAWVERARSGAYREYYSKQYGVAAGAR